MANGRPESIHPYVSEYLQRKKLIEVGYRFEGSSLSAKKAEAFLFISDLIAEWNKKPRTGNNG